MQTIKEIVQRIGVGWDDERKTRFGEELMREQQRRAEEERFKQSWGYEGLPGCETCGGLGYFKLNVPPRDPAFGKLQMCSCHVRIRGGREADLAARWQDSGVPESMRAWSLEYLRQFPGREEAIAAVEFLWTARHGWLALWGEPGVGKTSAATSLVCLAIRAGLKARISNPEQILEQVRDTFHDHAPEQQSDVMRRFTAYDLLVVDEMDPARFNATPFALSALFRVLDARYVRRYEAMTVFTSNASPRTLDARTWGYLVDRMEEGAMIEMGGGSLRGKRPIQQAGQP